MDWFTAYYNSVARHFGTKPFRPIDILLHGSHFAPDVLLHKSKGPAKDDSAVHVSWTFQAEGHFSPPKDETISAPIHSGNKTSWPLTCFESLGRAG